MSESFRLTILGCTAATPTSTSHTSSQWLQAGNNHFLLDCAEGTQMQIRKMKLPLMKINHIFISHLHGDHYLGLPGLIFSYHLLGRTKDLHVYSPKGLKEVIDIQHEIANVKTRFNIIFHEVNYGGQKLFENNSVEVEAIKMEHSIPCFGFLIKEKTKERNIIKACIDKYKIGIDKIADIKKGADFLCDDGTLIPNSEITKEPPKPRSYAFCSDTLYTESFINQVKNVDLLYHEATFLQDKANIAKEKTHATAMEAAKVAKKANAGQLLIGHYSARYDDINEFLNEAKSFFQNTILAKEGITIDI